jgi:hypothetical protein
MVPSLSSARWARPSSLRLGSTFLKIGAVAFGGLGATLALIESELVQRQRVVSREELTEALTYTKFLPGSTVVQVVAYLPRREIVAQGNVEELGRALPREAAENRPTERHDCAGLRD